MSEHKITPRKPTPEMTDALWRNVRRLISDAEYPSVVWSAMWDAAPAVESPSAPAPRMLVGVSSIDIEHMLAKCVPGGSSCDPQQVADAIRAYCDAWNPDTPAQTGAHPNGSLEIQAGDATSARAQVAPAGEHKRPVSNREDAGGSVQPVGVSAAEKLKRLADEFGDAVHTDARKPAGTPGRRFADAMASRAALHASIDEVCAQLAGMSETTADRNPYLYVYEYESVHGLYRSFYPHEWNGMQPTRVVALYVTPTDAMLMRVAERVREECAGACLEATYDNATSEYNIGLASARLAITDLDFADIVQDVKDEK